MHAGVMFNANTGAVVVRHVHRTTSHWERMRGLLARPALAPDNGLWLVPCTGVHTVFMRYAIDVVFLDKSLVVLHIEPALTPWRSALRLRARSSLELAAGAAAASGLALGQQLRWHAHG